MYFYISIRSIFAIEQTYICIDLTTSVIIITLTLILNAWFWSSLCSGVLFVIIFRFTRNISRIYVFSNRRSHRKPIPHGVTSEDLGEVGLSFGSQLQWPPAIATNPATELRSGYGGRIGTNSGGGVRFGTTL